MSSQRIDPYKNYNFLVTIDGVQSAGFSTCVIPDASVEVIEYREGSDSTMAVRKLPGRVRYSNIVLKRGLTDSQDLWTWFNNIATGVADRRTVTITLLDDARNPVVKWSFSNAWPTKYEVSPLNGKGNEVTIETLEIAQEKMEIAKSG